MLTHARAYGYNIREAQEFQSVRRLYLSHVLPPPPALAAHVSACISSSNHASPAPSPTASASAHGLEVLEQPEAVGRVRLGPALDREEVEPRGGLLALLEELRLELLLRVLYPRQQVPAGPKRRTAPKRRACGWRRPGRKAARLAAPAPLRRHGPPAPPPFPPSPALRGPLPQARARTSQLRWAIASRASGLASSHRNSRRRSSTCRRCSD